MARDRAMPPPLGRLHGSQILLLIPQTTRRVAGRVESPVWREPGPSPRFCVGQGVGAVVL